MMHTKFRSRTLPLVLAMAALAACGGPARVGELGQGGGRPELLSVEVGRLVDVYSYRIIDPALNGGGDRRMRSNRRLELIAENVIINSSIDSQSLFTQTGAPNDAANYEFLRFDKDVGHEQLVILWDDRDGAEQQRFQDALAAAQQGLSEVPASYRGQNTQTRPIPIVARNAAIRLRFSSRLEVDPSFFETNPSAVQVLEFKGDPAVVEPADAFRILPYRVIPQGDSIILDTTILGGEANGGVTSPGLPLSSDSTTANIRVAIPTRGSVSSVFYVREDPIKELQGVDSAGRNSTIRDFRSGNLSDGAAGRLSEPEVPQIVATLSMGIVGVDADANTVTLRKRFHTVPVRGRYPFVDGPMVPLGDGMVGKGPGFSPLKRPLLSGDILVQTVINQETGEQVTLRAEVLENLGVISTDVAGVGTWPSPPTGPNGEVDEYSQGAYQSEITVRVATVSPGRDANGQLVSFRANQTAQGEDCLLRTFYVDDLRFSSGSDRLTDRAWKDEFVRIEPNAGNDPGANVAPNASVAIEFTKPMDLDQVDNSSNLLITNTAVAVESFADQMTDPKVATRRVVPTRLTDLSGDGTVLRLQPPMGFAHVAGSAEPYAVHVRLGDGGVVDLAGQSVEVFDDESDPQDSWSVDFQMDVAANSNLVGWHSYLFNAEDEDGTLAGSVDMFGQFRLEGGRLIGASAVRLKRSANNQNLQSISRVNRGECWDSGDPTDGVDNPFGYPGTPIPPDGTGNTFVPPVAGPPAGVVPVSISGLVHPGNLYWAPLMADQIAPPAVPQVYEYYQTVPQPVGRVIEPLKPQGSRMQMRYIEDDFSLSYTQPSEFALDVEQLYWSPFNNETVLYDVFDRFTMSLGHARTRPDENWLLFIDPNNVAWCTMDCTSMNSGLSTVFADNVLEGTSLVPVFEDEIYTINPNAAIHDAVGVAYVPFPRFDRSYTWRDSRLVTVDATGQVIGLGGTLNPGNGTSNDSTADIDSPWITSRPDPEFLTSGGTGVWTQDPADFVGTNQRDHDPIALPLLVDFKVFAENAGDPNAAQGRNGFQVAMLGPPSNGFPADPGGYYDATASGCGGGFPRWPRTRVQASGGFDLITGAAVYIDPANALNALPSVVKDAGLGAATTALFTAPAGDGMLHWTRADMVRKISTVTFGFFDTLMPQQYATEGGVLAGLPNWSGTASLRPTDLVVQLDPPQTRQPAGTGVVVELRGAATFENDDEIYNPALDDTEAGRGNLLNPNYACEAYRYSTANVFGAPRVSASGLTKYVTEDKINDMRDAATGLLPRFLNVRLVMTNNVTVTPSLSPSLRSMSVVYRLVPGPF